MLFVNSIFTALIIKPRLYDGSVNELGRYSMTFDAYEYISKNSDAPIISIGSSKMREAFDGVLIAEHFEETMISTTLLLQGIDLTYACLK